MVTPTRSMLLDFRSSRHPFQVLILTACLGYGLLCVFAPSKAATTIRALPGPGPLLFGLTMAISALLCAANLARQNETRLLVERLGMWALCGQTVSFLILTAFYVGQRGVGLVIFLGCVCVAAASRAVMITRNLRDVRRQAVS